MILMSINDVIELSEGEVFRILYVSGDNMIYYAIKLNTIKQDIRCLTNNDMEMAFANGAKYMIDDEGMIVEEEELTKPEKRVMRKGLEVIKNIFSKLSMETFCRDRKKRRKAILECVEECKSSEKSVRRYIMRYLQGGQVKYSLIPRFNSCGGRNKVKSVGIKKRGRKNVITELTGYAVGINITPEIQKIFNKYIAKYYLSTNTISLKKVYKKMLGNEFTIFDGTEYKVKADDEIPSYAQFKYWYYKERDIEKEKRAKIGNRKVDLNYKKIKSDSIFETKGPGARYQIDATIGDVYLVSSVDRASIIGRPVVYMIVDTFSRMIVGLHVGLEGPSWNGAATTLYNCMEDKQKYCEKYGIELNDGEWNVKGLPSILLADRGEMVCPISNNIIEGLKITIENTPSYMGCAKGIVEQFFNVINLEIKHYMPGAVKKDFLERGSKDYRKEAILNIEEFTKIMILAVRKRNNQCIDYPLTKKMLEDGVKPIPQEIWNWGIKNLSGNLRNVPKKTLVLNLLRKDRACVERKGIKFKGLFYNCEYAIEKNWCFIAQSQKNFYVNIRYDERNITVIWIEVDRGRYEEARLIETMTRNTKFEGVTVYEVEDYNYNTGIKKLEYEKHNNNIDINFDKEIENIIAAAKKTKVSKKTIRGIKDNRKNEKLLMNEEVNLINKLYKKQEIEKHEENKSEKIVEDIYNKKTIDFLRERLKNGN
ncbi:MAG: Mu transposase C-terminal domain-containing protein [Clostridium sp.]|uniref:Mu transposase C-terminal domain-containing protein n=1 Tax=Clostridium sp. TaxID=1506 RepID=UPI003F2D2DB8